MSPFHEKCIQLLETMPKGHARSCFRSALHHLRCARIIAKLDPAMAMFRAITAEEEAASGLMRCLQRRKYRHATQLNPRNHEHKSAVVPFLALIGKFLDETLAGYGIKPIVHLGEHENRRRLLIAFPMTVNGQAMHAQPIPPLNFEVSTEGKSPSYLRQVEAFVERSGASTIHAYIKQQANLRNQLLYAEPGGYPVVRAVDLRFIDDREGRVLMLLKTYLLIDPYRERQPFVQASLNAMVALLKNVRIEGLHDEV